MQPGTERGCRWRKDPPLLVIYDALDLNRWHHLPYHLTEAGCHLDLRPRQVGTWEVVREAHSCGSKELVTNTTPRDPAQLSRLHLDLWRVSIWKDHLLRRKYFSASTASADIKVGLEVGNRVPT